ncbi:acylneuraminate cytidylyltransferase family protein [Wenyingzhuangia marina]|uniref:N-acylneuraminate cytidylyltransferase n=1 Tax=Wenyingzhuangia marina TaxID=1195760 RepID=A0A1M5UA53_9FLAO|nr:acylneuraminate cytidylyltransferase family protein [Wenyingzhuangia marina]GGF68823.1 N-acylneuraminate cytidylyltransferase [Wenyingzhuangia marina]SHH59726.1 N-acylneuraminate cytidylyltransferase [Wenyingzhuangia marina]
MKGIVVIPARGGSKRLPNKNIKLLGGIPLLVHSINYAKTMFETNSIVVSTDYAEIKKIALENNIRVIDRPKEISGDLATSVEVLQHVAKTVEEDYDTFILLQPTNPLRPKELLKEAIELYQKGEYDSLMTVSENEHKLGKIVNDKFKPFTYELGQRSQDLEPLYYENGLLYITKKTEILKGNILGENHYPFIVNHSFSKIDIDTLEDFELAEFYLNKYQNE